MAFTKWKETGNAPYFSCSKGDMFLCVCCDEMDNKYFGQWKKEYNLHNEGKAKNWNVPRNYSWAVIVYIGLVHRSNFVSLLWQT